MNVQRSIRFVENALATIMDLFPRAPTEQETALGRRLEAELRAIAASGEAASREAGAGSAFWRATCGALVTIAAENEPRFFMRWAPIRATMVHGATQSIVADWWRLRRSAEWRATWAPALRHRQYGHPPPFPPMMASNAMAIEHATHLFRFREATGAVFHDTDCIIEFGGGYGSMCRLIHALGFRGTYIIFDLPHVLALQRYYLALHGIDAETSAGAASGVHLLSDLDLCARLIDRLRPPHLSAISTWALSEMPLPVRERIETFLLLDCCRQVLLSYQSRFEGNDNLAYFTGLAARTRASTRWMEIPFPSSDSRYLFGTRREINRALTRPPPAPPPPPVRRPQSARAPESAATPPQRR
jgi:hypothetical protein